MRINTAKVSLLCFFILKLHKNNIISWGFHAILKFIFLKFFKVEKKSETKILRFFMQFSMIKLPPPNNSPLLALIKMKYNYLLELNYSSSTMGEMIKNVAGVKNAGQKKSRATYWCTTDG